MPAAAVIGGAALIGGVGSIIGSNKAASAARNAAATQAQAADQATAEQQREFDLQQQNLSPFLKTGTTANSQLSYLLGLGGTDASGGMTGAAGSLAQPFTLAQFQESPDYQFTLSEGQKALARAQAAGGNYFSGAAIKGLENYNQNMASQQYQNAFNNYNTNQSNLYNRLAGLSNTGQSAAVGINNAAQNTGNQISSNIIGAGNALAAGQVGAGNAYNSALGGIGNNLMYGAGMYSGMQNPNYLGQGTGLNSGWNSPGAGLNVNV